MSKETDILKWFNGEISTKEIKALYPNEDFSALEKSAFYSKQFEVPQINAEEALKDFKARSLSKAEPKVIPLNFRSFLKVAAILVVMLTSSYFLFFNNTASYNTEIAETTNLILPDDSEVFLNAKSTLSYNKKAWKKERTLHLDGEAFFKVTKGNTFTVQTEAGSIEVIGTQFNVKERHKYFEVKCYEGSVGVNHKGKTAILTPGKTVRVVNGVIMDVDDFYSQNPSWLAKESSFSKVPLWQVIDELQRQYNISIAIGEGVNDSELFSGSFTHTDKNVALQAVTIPLKLSYKINGSKVEFYNYESN
ncbi:MAG: FecR family protein [Winogradskyella sp.]|uniref:FecR family protein n=1 Tax=Winogradskyella sp. TaxID=1883156 RepID=UPI0017F6DC5C|nr:FecR family protein [Winogradskyella sp.]